MISTCGDLGAFTRQPYQKLTGLDGDIFIIDCDTIAAIDEFMMSECSKNMTQTDIDYAMDLIVYQDTGIGRSDIVSLDTMMAMMVTTGYDCTTVQGEISGC